MSYIVLHMDKFKKEAVRGIQSHNNRERESRSNPDIDYGRSGHNYDLREPAAENYSEAIQNRIDDLLLVKAVRKDAVHLCGLIVSSDSAFFEKLTPEDSKRFFEESRAFLTDFVGAENVVSAMVHLDEKTPHMHFLHVPVTPEGRLSAKTIYTRESLKMLQTEMPRHLQSRGFDLQRGVEQEPGAAKKHLNTREFKQQQEALRGLQQEAQAVSAELEQRQREEAAMRERVQSYEQQAQEAEKVLADQPAIPEASMFSYKPALEKAQHIIEQQKKALASKHLLAAKNEQLQVESGALKKRVEALEAEKCREEKRSLENVKKWMDESNQLRFQLEEINTFFRWNPEANKMHLDYIQEQRREAARKTAEQKQKALEREQQEKQLQEERERQAQERQKAQELERQQRELENSPARQWPSPSRGMGMGR